MMNLAQKLEESIAEKIKNYQKNLNDWKFDDEHVDKWINQFPADERIIVLTETDNLLAHNYMSKRKIKEFFVWATEEIIGKSPMLSIDKIQFLNIQGRGNSQRRLVDLLEEYYLRKKGITINRENHSNIKKYIYLDDCMFTGFRLIKDINDWIDYMHPNKNTQLDVIFLGKYNGNYNYVIKQLQKKCSERRINVDIYSMYEYNNDLKNLPPYDVLWPQYMDDDEYVNAFVKEMEEQKKNTKKGELGFRNPYSTQAESKLFTSSQNRIIFEKALLKKGAYICSLPQCRNERMKPMGYSHIISLGFGAFFATCYNISNNCPLAFWWGNMQSSSSETLGKWYPLLPREVHQQ